MAGPSDYVSVVVSVSNSLSPTKQAFGVPLIAGFHTHNTDRVRFYTSAAAMVADGFLTTEPTYLAAQRMFSAKNGPLQIGVGRRSNAPLQVLTLTCTSVTAGDVYSATFVGSDGVAHALTLVSTGVPATDVATINTAVTAFAIPGCTATHSTTILTLTQTASHMVDVQGWCTFLQLADITADPGITADIAAIIASAPSSWYALVLDSNSLAEAHAAATAIEATGVGGKFLFTNTSDFGATQVGTTTDIFSVLKASSYNKTFCVYSGKQLLSYAGAAACAYALPQNPGSYDLAYAQLPGVIADDDTSLTQTQKAVLNSASTSTPGTGGKNGNYYKTVSGLNILFPGVAGGGQWVDITIGIDWLQATIQADVLAALVGSPKIAYTDAGIGLLADVLERDMNLAASPAYGLLVDGTIVITKPRAAAVSVTDRANRNLPGLAGAARLSGGVNTVGVNVTLSP